MKVLKLRNHIPIGGPARREPADGTEGAMRVSLGFEPAWFHRRCGVDFSEKWHADPYYRYDSLRLMKAELVRSFPTVTDWDLANPQDLATLSGIYGINIITSLYGLPVIYAADRWPVLSHARKLSLAQIETLSAAKLLQSPFVEKLLRQMDIIQSEWGKIHGYLNWQGVLNNAFHLRGQEIFIDFYDRPEFVHQLFATLCEVMIRLTRLVQAKQRQSGFTIDQLSVSNCVVNMISPDAYREFVYPYDRKIALSFERFGVHTCNWDITPYIKVVRELPNLGYLDMGMMSDLKKVRSMFADVRRAVMYSPVTLQDAPLNVIEEDMRRVYAELAPCDIVMADVQADTPDERVNAILKICRILETVNWDKSNSSDERRQ
jgi:hypothetical protein